MIILDEATSALDSVSEALVQQVGPSTGKTIGVVRPRERGL